MTPTITAPHQEAYVDIRSDWLNDLVEEHLTDLPSGDGWNDRPKKEILYELLKIDQVREVIAEYFPQARLAVIRNHQKEIEQRVEYLEGEARKLRETLALLGDEWR